MAGIQVNMNLKDGVSPKLQIIEKSLEATTKASNGVAQSINKITPPVIKAVNATKAFERATLNMRVSSQKTLESYCNSINRRIAADDKAAQKAIANRGKELQAVLKKSLKEIELNQKVANFIESVNNKALASTLKRTQAEQAAATKAANAKLNALAKEFAATQKAEQKAISSEQKKDALRAKSFEKQQSQMAKMIVQAEKREAREQAAAAKTAQAKINSLAKEFAARVKLNAQLEKQAAREQAIAAKSAQAKINATAKEFAAKIKAKAKADEQLRVEQAQIAAVNKRAGAVTKVNEKYRQATSLLRQMEAAQARGADVTNEAVRAQQQIVSARQKIVSLTNQLVSAEGKRAALVAKGKGDSVRAIELMNKEKSIKSQIQAQSQKILSLEQRKIPPVATLNKMLQKSKQAENATAQAATKTTQAIRNNAKVQQQFNNYVRGGVSESNRLLSSVRNVAMAYLGAQGGGSLLQTVDQLTLAESRIGVMNNGLETTEQIMDKIYQSSMNSRSGYMETADIVGKLAMRAGDVFSSMDENIAFVNTLQKSFALCGSTTAEMNSAMLQMAQALGSGRMQGDELKSTLENNALAAEAIAKAMGVSKGELKDLGAKGELSASMVKNAILKSADEINKKFEQMPVTFGQVWEMFKSFSLKAFQPLLKAIAKITSSERFIGVVDKISRAVVKMAELALKGFEKLSDIAAYVYDNWQKLNPALSAVIGAVIAFAAAVTVCKIAFAAYNIVSAVTAARQKMLARETFAATVQQTSLGAAMLACPLFWYAAAIAVIIGVLAACALSTYDWEKSNIDVVGTIRNIYKKLGKFIKENVLAAWEKLKEVGAKVRDALVPVAQALFYAWNKLAAPIFGIGAIIAKIGWVILSYFGSKLMSMWNNLKSIGESIGNTIRGIADAIVNNWSWIGPIIYGVVAAFVLYKLVMFAFAAAKFIAVAATTAYSVAMGIATAATALFTSPVFLVILAIGLLIAAFFGVINAINSWLGTSISAIGIICAVFMGLYATVYNIIATIWNYIASFAEFFLNVFDNPIYSAQMLFINLGLNILGAFGGIAPMIQGVMTSVIKAIEWAVNQCIGFLNSLINAVPDKAKKWLGLGNAQIGKVSFSDKVPNIVGNVDALKAKLEGMKGQKPEGYKTVGKMEHKNIAAEAGAGYNFGKGLDDKVSNFSMDDITSKFSGVGDKVGNMAKGLIQTKDPAGKVDDSDMKKALQKKTDNPAAKDFGKENAGNLKDIKKNTGDTAKNTDESNNDNFKYLRQMAERESMNTRQLMNFDVKMTNNNSMKSGLDINSVMQRLARELYNEVNYKLEGV